jgi:hypothetical protein
MAYVEVDVHLDEVYDNLSSWEKDELVEKLIEDGYKMKDPNREYEDEYGDEEFNGTPLDYEWKEMIKKINDSRYQLTPEQERMLVNLAKSL